MVTAARRVLTSRRAVCFFHRLFVYWWPMVQVVAHGDTDSFTDLGEPTTPDIAEEITFLLSGRFNIQYSIVRYGKAY